MNKQARQAVQAGETVRFEYNEDGLRVRKIATSTETTECIYHGNELVHMINGSNHMHFFYDAQGRAAVVDYNGTPYIYLHNLLGDVIGLVDQGGALVVILISNEHSTSLKAQVPVKAPCLSAAQGPQRL